MNGQRGGINGSTPWVRMYRFAFAMLCFGAVAVQLRESSNIVNFFSFFTVQSNIIGAAVLLALALVVPKETHNWSLIRGGAVIYLVLTGVIYNTLLVEITEQLQTTIPWVNDVLHKVMPVVMLIDLLIVPLAHRLRWREAVVWTMYPLLYLGYSLIRGAFVDWYPYPFLNPGNAGGYFRVFGFSVVVLAGFLAFTWLITEVNAWRIRMGNSKSYAT